VLDVLLVHSLTWWLLMRPQLQILWSVIIPDTVLMVDLLV
jgi:hypothetical protein